MYFLKRLDTLLPSTPRGAAYVAFAMFAGFGLAILLVESIVGVHSGFAGIRHDGYWELGVNLIRGNGFVFEAAGDPVFHRPPLAPALFGPLTLLPEPLQRPGLVLLQSLMLAITCGLTFDLAKRVLDRRAARCALVVLLGYPFFYLDVKDPLNIIAQAMCVTAVFYLLGLELLQANRPESRGARFPWARATVLGLAATGAILTHGTMLLAVPALIACAGLVGIRLGSFRVLKVAMTAGLIVAISLAPWTYRNWRVTGKFMPVVGGVGIQYFVGADRWGHNDNEGLAANWNRIVSASLGRNVPDAKQVIHFWGFRDPALEAVANRRMVADLRSDPGFFARRILCNAAEFYIPSTRDILMPRTAPTMRSVCRRAALSLWHLGLLGFAGVGLLRGCRKGKAPAMWLAIGAIVLLASGYLPFVAGIGHCQYCLQTLPLLAMLAAANFAFPSRAGDGRVIEPAQAAQGNDREPRPGARKRAHSPVASA